MHVNDGVVGGQCLETIGCRNERKPSEVRDLSNRTIRKAWGGGDSGTDCSSTERKLVDVWKRGLDMRDRMIELRNVAGELLAQGEGSRVHEVGAADFYD